MSYIHFLYSVVKGLSVTSAWFSRFLYSSAAACLVGTDTHTHARLHTRTHLLAHSHFFNLPNCDEFYFCNVYFFKNIYLINQEKNCTQNFNTKNKIDFKYLRKKVFSDISLISVPPGLQLKELFERTDCASLEGCL